MANIAVIQNEIVVNTIIADSVEIAEEITGLKCIEFLPPDFPAAIGWLYNGEIFINPVAYDDTFIP